MGARLDNGIEIAVVTEMVHDIDVQLMITALTGIIRDKGGIIRSVRGDVLIRAVNGNAVITFEFGADGDSLIEATQEFGEGFFCEFAALMDESGFGRAVQRVGGIAVFRMAGEPEVGDFTVQRGSLHAHGQQNGILERQAPVAGEISAGVHDKFFGMLFHV